MKKVVHQHEMLLDERIWYIDACRAFLNVVARYDWCWNRVFYISNCFLSAQDLCTFLSKISDDMVFGWECRGMHRGSILRINRELHCLFHCPSICKRYWTGVRRLWVGAEPAGLSQRARARVQFLGSKRLGSRSFGTLAVQLGCASVDLQSSLCQCSEVF